MLNCRPVQEREVEENFEYGVVIAVVVVAFVFAELAVVSCCRSNVDIIRCRCRNEDEEAVKRRETLRNIVVEKRRIKDGERLPLLNVGSRGRSNIFKVEKQALVHNPRRCQKSYCFATLVQRK